jgi:hypothetical protein
MATYFGAKVNAVMLLCQGGEERRRSAQKEIAVTDDERPRKQPAKLMAVVEEQVEKFR